LSLPLPQPSSLILLPPIIHHQVLSIIIYLVLWELQILSFHSISAFSQRLR
jgi:hypothetical protein